MSEWLVAVVDGAGVWLTLELGRATVLLAVAVVVAVVLRRASAATRHVLWFAALVSLLALPAVSALLPWRWSPPAVFAGAGAPGRVDRSPAGTVEGVLAAPGGIGDVARARSTPAPLGEASEPAAPSRQERAVGLSSVVRDNALTLVLVIWALGALIALGRLAAGWLVLRRTVRRARWEDDPAWRRPLYEAADRLDLRATPHLVSSDRMAIPCVTGVLRPTIVLPASAADWSTERRWAVLLHELAHVRRRDLLLGTIAHVACALWWFHPLARVAVKRLRVESERACDDLVLRLGTRPSAYADHLLQIVRAGGHATAPAAALPMAQRREFEGRMLAILEADARRDPAGRRHALLATFAAVLLVLPLAALGPAPLAADEAALSPEAVVEHDGDAVPTVYTRPGEANEQAGQSGRADSPDRAERPNRDAEAGTADERSSPDLADVLRNASAPARAGSLDVAGAAGTSQDTAVVTALRNALRDPSGEVRAEAAWALGTMDAAAAGPDIAAVLGGDVSPEVRRMAIWALVQLRYSAGAQAIAAAARSDESADVREMAVWALGQFRDPETLPVMVAALGDGDVRVREIAGWAIGTLRPDEAPAALIAALEDDDGEVREHAAWALGQIGDPAAIGGLTRVVGDGVAGEAALWAIGNIGGEAARPALLEALRSGNDEVRASAARALAGRSGRPWPWPWPRPMPRH